MNKITTESILAQMRVLSSQIQPPSAMTTKVDGLNARSESSALDFSSLLKKSIDQVNTQQLEAKQLATAFDKGNKEIELSEVMISMQKANVSFQAMLEVRNKLVNAYQDIMNMQV